MCVFAFELRSLWAKDSSHGWPVDVFSGLRGAAKMPLADFVELTFFFFFTRTYLTSLGALCQQGEAELPSSFLVFPCIPWQGVTMTPDP